MASSNQEHIAQLLPADHRWLTVELLEPGMVLARPVVAVTNRVLSFKLGEGSELTPSMIGQLYARGIECVAVAIPPPDEVEMEAWRAQCAAYAQRLDIIFSDGQGGIDPSCRPLYDLLLTQGPQR